MAEGYRLRTILTMLIVSVIALGIVSFGGLFVITHKDTPVTEQIVTEQSPSDTLTHVEKIISKSMEESKDGIRYYVYTEANQKMEVDKDTYHSTSIGDNILTD